MKKFQKQFKQFTGKQQYRGTRTGFYFGNTGGFYTQKIHNSLFVLSDRRLSLT